MLKSIKIFMAQCQMRKKLLWFHYRVEAINIYSNTKITDILPEFGSRKSFDGSDTEQRNEALHLLQTKGIRANFSTYVFLLQLCLNNKSPSQGKLVHSHIIQTGFHPDMYLGNMLVIMYVKCENLEDARKVFDEMPERNVVSWTAMISAYASHGFVKEALKLFFRMRQTGVQPNQFSYSSILPACANLAALEHGKEIHGDIIKTGFHSDVFVGSALVDMYIKCRVIEDARQVFDEMLERSVVSWTAMVAGYAQCGCLDEALELFQKMPERNAVSWTAMIAGYTQNGHVGKALKLFHEMPERYLISWNAMISGCTQRGCFVEALELFQQMCLTDVKPNSVTLTSLLPACANLAALEKGKEVHEDIIRNGFQSDIFVGNALIDMYAKCGSIDGADKVFHKMPRRDVVSWSSMIVGYALHGRAYDALQLFKEMQHLGTKPDYVTLVGVLSACCHAGLVDDARQYFDRMVSDYGIKPGLEHYSCMVDLFGRAGRLIEAWDIISKMPMKPDVIVWGSLLAACRVHGNVKLGEYAAERLFELDPENAAHYVLLSNMYATVGRWDGVQKMRRVMKDRRVKKMPGCSWIGSNNKLNTFVV